MLHVLQSADVWLLLFFNGLHNSACDFFFYWVSNRFIWIPFYLFLAYTIYIKHPHRFVSILVFIGITIVLTDQLSSTVLKNVVGRLRPCHNPSIADKLHLVNGECGGQYGFVSGHAANSFAVFKFLNLLFGEDNKILRRIILCWAITVAFSRIYLGVHYPGDVIFGALLGWIISFCMYRTHRFYLSDFAPVVIKKRKHRSSKEK